MHFFSFKWAQNLLNLSFISCFHMKEKRNLVLYLWVFYRLLYLLFQLSYNCFCDNDWWCIHLYFMLHFSLTINRACSLLLSEDDIVYVLFMLCLLHHLVFGLCVQIVNNLFLVMISENSVNWVDGDFFKMTCIIKCYLF